MESILRDLRFGFTLLRRDRAFTTTVLLTLGVCIGINVAIYSVVHAVILKPLPFHEPDRLVTMYKLYPGLGVGREQAANSGPDFFFRRERVGAFAEVAAYLGMDVAVGDAAGIEHVRSLVATPSLLPLLGVSPALGRGFLEEEMTPDQAPTVILTHGYWQARFGGAADVLERTLRVDGRDATIVGVLPPGFRMPDVPDVRLLLPAVFPPQQRAIGRWHSNGWAMLGRLAPGATLAQAQAEIDALDASLAAEAGHPQWLANSGFHTVVVDARQDLIRNVQTIILVLWGGVALVLLIGCANVANLMLARSQSRLREVVTRMALGASRGRLARQILTEAALIGLLGAAAGAWVGAAALGLLHTLGVEQLPRGIDVGLDGTVLLYTMALAVGSSVLIGAIPIAHLFRTDLNTVLRAEGRGGTTTRSAIVFRGMLVAGQVSLAFVLLAGSGLMLRSLQAALDVHPGFAADHVFTGRVSLPGVLFPDADARRRFADDLLADLRALPGVSAAAVTNALPFGAGGGDNVIAPEGYEPAPGESLVSPLRTVAGPGYFDAMGMQVIEGRDFEERDGPGVPTAMIIDERLARRYWPDRSPLGHGMLDGSAVYTVVGVVNTIKHRDLTAADASHVGAYYLSYRQVPQAGLNVVVRTAGEPAAIAGSVRDALTRVHPDVPLFDAQTLERRVAASLDSRRSPLVLLLVMAGVALLLAVVGTYGLLAYAVALRTREIGIRLALGATPAAILGLVLKQGLSLAAIGLAIGLGAAVLLVRLIQSLLFGVEPTDPLVLLGTAALLGVAVAAACLVPARRATRIDPAVALADG